MKPYKILIIEDDPVIQSELETLLRGNGYISLLRIASYSCIGHW